MSTPVRRLRLLTLFACLLAGLSAAPSAAPARAKRSWAQAEIRLVVAHGLMARSVAAFRPNDPLTQDELRDLVTGLSEESPPPSPPPLGKTGVPVTMAQLDGRLVRTLGFGDEAALFYQAAAAAGLHPPARFGTEVVARLLGLRTNHPADQDDLERLPSDPAPRAEVAYSVARVLRLSDWELRSVEQAAAAFELPVLTPWQRRILTTAVGFIGFPYVWGGESELPISRLQAPGLPRSPAARDHPARAHGSRDGRRSSAAQAHQARSPRACRPPLLRSGRASRQARADRPHGDLPGQRLADPVLSLRRRARSCRRLV
jgi:hypothetical protein